MAVCIRQETARKIEDEAKTANLSVKDYLRQRGYPEEGATQISKLVRNTLNTPTQQVVTTVRNTSTVLRDGPRNRAKLRANIRNIMEVDGLLETKRITTGGKKWGEISQKEINEFLASKNIELDKTTQRDVKQLMSDAGLLTTKQDVRTYNGAENIIEAALGRKVVGDIDTFMRGLSVNELNKIREQLLSTRTTRGNVVISQGKGTALQTDWTLQVLSDLTKSITAGTVLGRGLRGMFEPIYWMFERLERIAPGVTDMFLRPVTKAQKLLNVEMLRLSHEMVDIYKTLKISRNGTEKITIDGLWDQPEARAGLEAMGITERPTLTDAELKAKKYLKDNVYEPMYARINKARAARGLEPIDFVPDYMTFFRDIELMTEAGYNILILPKAKYDANVRALRQVGLRHATKRVKGSKIPFKLNSLSNAINYTYNSLRFVHLAPVVGELRSHLTTEFNLANIAKKHGADIIPSELVGKKDFQLMRDGYPIAEALNNWLDVVIGTKKKHQLEWLDPAASWINRSLAVGYLSGSLRFFLIQPTVLARVWHQLGFFGGPKHLFKGALTALSDYFKATPDLRRGPGKHMRGARAESNVLSVRTFDAFVEHTVDTLTGRSKVSLARHLYEKVGDVGIRPGQLIDEVSAVVSWYAAKSYGEKVLKLKGEKLVNYADDIVLYTQGSGARIHRAPVQRTPTGQTLTLFQTFLINDFFNMTRQTTRGRMSQRMRGKTRDAIKSMIAFATTTALVNTLYESIGMNPPFPAPISAFLDEVDEQGNVTMGAFIKAFKELGEGIPIIGGSLKYGGSLGGPAIDMANTVTKKLNGDERTPPWPVIFGRISGFPGTAPAYQLYKLEKKQTPSGRGMPAR